jgi:hypothetical protein
MPNEAIEFVDSLTKEFPGHVVTMRHEARVTVRDHFAAAMLPYLARRAVEEHLDDMLSRHDIACDAYKWADLMLKVRQYEGTKKPMAKRPSALETAFAAYRERNAVKK